MKKIILAAFMLAMAVPAFAESLTGSDLQSFMKSRKMSFDAGSVANFSNGSVSMKHRGSKALKGSYKVGKKSVSMSLSDGTKQTFTIDQVSKHKFVLRYSSGPYKGKKFSFR